MRRQRQTYFTAGPKEVRAWTVPIGATAPQAARILSIGRTALYQLIWDGQLTPIHIGRSVRFSVDQLESFVQNRFADVRVGGQSFVPTPAVDHHSCLPPF